MPSEAHADPSLHVDGRAAGANTPLDGLRVVCFAELYPGPYATSLLVDLGAEVVIVERPGGERGRAIPDFFAAFARGKRSVSVDLKAPDALRRLDALLRRADVVFEGFSPGTAERLGIGYEALRRINPGLIYASISGFGQTGPFRSRPAHDLSYQAFSGVLAEHASPNALPTIASGDVGSALFSVIGVLAALQARSRTGKGTFVDVSVTDCLVSCMAPWVGPVLNGRAPLSAADAPANGLFRTADGRILSLSVMQEDDFWKRLCELIDLPEHADLDFDRRGERAAELRAIVADRIGRREMSYWASELDARRIAWSPVHSYADVAQERLFHERRLFDSIAGPDGGTFRFIRQPLRFSNFGNAPISGVPAVGESNARWLSSSGGEPVVGPEG